MYCSFFKSIYVGKKLKKSYDIFFEKLGILISLTLSKMIHSFLEGTKTASKLVGAIKAE